MQNSGLGNCLNVIASLHQSYEIPVLLVVSFVESSVFPIPPDIMLLPMSLARPKRAWWFATVCTIASVADHAAGYAIGALLYDSLGQWLINLYGLSGKVEAFRQSYAEWGAVIILLKGLTPIPYKLVTITSGFAGYNIWLFILCSIVARGGRFFVVAVLLNRYGDVIRAELEKRLGLWVGIGAAVLVLGFYIAFQLI
jgi:membrane protein YqaA with SNARE-associated domain